MTGKKKPGKPGRPTLFVPDVRRMIIQTIASGSPLEYGAAMAGIDISTLKNWLRIGRALVAGEDFEGIPKDKAKQEEFITFLAEVDRARAAQKIQAVQSIIKAGRDNWRHSMTGIVRLSPPPAVTWYNKATGELLFDDPGSDGSHESDEWERQLSGSAWVYTPGNWNALAWYLERSDNERWGRHDRLDVNINIVVLKRFIKVVEEAGANPEEALIQFEEMIRAELELAREKGSPPSLGPGSG